MFALVDCNNFYASCEKLFRPDLRDAPVIVLSNNDGCAIARSREAKALGIKMGVPLFKIRREIRRHRIAVFSSNYTLYADMSSRVMRTLEELAPRLEVYSIDEAFLDLTGVAAAVSLEAFGRQVRQAVGQRTGITVCVGMAPTKTLAKLANHAAKQYRKTGGVVDLSARERQRKLLSLLPVDEVWGIGRRLTKQLQVMGITTALQLAEANPTVIRRHFSVVVERTVRELNGESCIELEEAPPTKKQIISSKSFGERITTLQQMREAVCDYVARAAEKLRGEGQYACVVTVFIQTSPFAINEPHYSNSATGKLAIPSDDTRDMTAMAMTLLQRIWRDGYRYDKAGIMLTDFYDPGVYQPSLLDPVTERSGSKALMNVLDEINQKGPGKVWFAGQGIQKEWAMRRDLLSPAYTTRWSDIPRVR